MKIVILDAFTITQSDLSFDSLRRLDKVDKLTDRVRRQHAPDPHRRLRRRLERGALAPVAVDRKSVV